VNYWNQTPLFRLLPAFISGILAGIFGIYLKPSAILLFCTLPFLVLAGQVLFRKFFSYKNRWMFGLSAQLLIFLFAYLLTELKTEIHDQDHFSKVKNASAFIAYLDDSKQEKTKSYKTTISIVAVKSENKWTSAKGKCLAYISKDSISADLRYGDLIIFTGMPLEVQAPGNPSQFNYKQWLSYNQVYHQLFLGSSTWKVIGHHYGHSVVEMSINMRDKLLKIFKDNNISGDDYAVVSALLLGDTDDIDQDILNAYSASGALHVLSVSGLHVGIIYIALNAMLFFMNKNKVLKLLKTGILILFLWYYALLTGLSPAVLRSAAMLSYIVIGKSLGRYTNMYNTLAASAMTLFCFHPHLLMQVGFQLSYLAVLGIVFLYQKIHLLFNPAKWLWKQIWSLTAVSIAAQISTFPLGLFYFHQFPNYFLISNMMVIPISTVIIYGGIVLFIISPFTALASWTGLILGKAVHLLNWTVITIEHLPYALLGGISITILETCLLYLSILMLILFMMKKENKYFFALMVAVVFILTSQINESVQLKKQKQFIVYDVPKLPAVNLIDGNSSVFISDSTLINNKSMMKFNVYNYWWDCGLDEDHVLKITKAEKQTGLKNSKVLFDKNFFMFGDKRILVLNEASVLKKSISVYFDVDYLIFSQNLKIKIADLIKKIHFKQLIIDSSNSLSRTDRWMTEAKLLGVDCYSVQRSGAFVVKFR
jgi:competence protein ComEC